MREKWIGEEGKVREECGEMELWGGEVREAKEMVAWGAVKVARRIICKLSYGRYGMKICLLGDGEA